MYTKRLNSEYRKIMKEPIECILARPDPKNILIWYFSFFNLKDSPYEDGIYLGQINFPEQYPYKPPDIRMLTPSGRF